MIHRHRGNRRKQDAAKAIRKRKLAKELYQLDWYDNLHEYSKGKIHCSCPMCRAKTNGKKNIKTGSTSNNWKRSDLLKIAAMEAKEKEYQTA